MLFAIGSARWFVAPSSDVSETTPAVAFDWSKESKWDTEIDPFNGTFSGSRIAKEFTTAACASQYDSIEPLFDLDPMVDKILLGNKSRESSRSNSTGSLSEQLRILILCFLENSKWITSGYHDWRTIGLVTQEDRTAVLIRYYRETATPIDLLDSEDILLPLTKMVTFDNFKIHCSDLFKTKISERTSDRKIQGYVHSTFYADKKFGYVILMLSGPGPNKEIEDLFDFQVQRPLSQLCSVWTGFSDTNSDQLTVDSALLPGPSDTDLSAIQEWLKLRNDSLSTLEPTAIRNSLNRLYAQTKDPLMLDLLGRLESDLGNRDLALEQFRKAEQGRFESLASHRALILHAIESQDQEQLIERLSQLHSYWHVKLTGLDAEEDRKRFFKFQGYWRRGEGLSRPSTPGSL
ncbi:MAG: hypothetical protein NTV29_04555 [Planctomycetota bacterium]|nr:hypothetical protein [Planctomycetota bacterium]